MTLKQDGLFGKYLLFMYKKLPVSFCSLLWMTLGSPLMGLWKLISLPFVCMFESIDFLFQTVNNYRINKLVQLYKTDSKAFLRDYIEHYTYAGKYNIHHSRKLHSHQLVRDAMEVLGYEVLHKLIVSFEILELGKTLGYLENDNETEVWNKFGTWSTARNRTWLKLCSKLNNEYIISIIVITMLWIVLGFPAVMIGDNTSNFVLLVVSTLSAVTLSANAFLVWEIPQFLYGIYQVVKERTCPIIEWK